MAKDNKAYIKREFEFMCRFGFGWAMRVEELGSYTAVCGAGAKGCPAIAYCDEVGVSHKCKKNDNDGRVDVVDFTGEAPNLMVAVVLRESVIKECAHCKYKQR